MTNIAGRLEYLRSQIRAESISYGEIAELQSLAAHIPPGDVELLEWAGVPESADDQEWSIALEDSDGDGSTLIAEFDTDGVLFNAETASRNTVLIKLSTDDCERLAAFLDGLPLERGGQ